MLKVKNRKKECQVILQKYTLTTLLLYTLYLFIYLELLV